MDNIVGRGLGIPKTGIESDLHTKAFGARAGENNPGQRTPGHEQRRIVGVHHAVVVLEAVFVETREIIGFGHPLAMRLLGETALQDGAEEGGGLLTRLEERPLPQLGLRLAVVVLRRQPPRIGATETGIVNLTANRAGVLNKGWFDFCHSIKGVLYYLQRRCIRGITEEHKNYCLVTLESGSF